MDRNIARIGFIITMTIGFIIYNVIMFSLILGWKIEWHVALMLILSYGIVSDVTARFSMILKGYRKDD